MITDGNSETVTISDVVLFPAMQVTQKDIMSSARFQTKYLQK